MTGLRSLACFALALAFPTLAAEPPPTEPVTAPAVRQAEPAVLRIVHRDVVTFRASTIGYSPAERAIGAQTRIVAAYRENPQLEFEVFDIPEGSQVRAGESPLFVVFEEDVNRLGGETPHAVASEAVARLQTVVTELRERGDPRALLVSLALAVAATLAWILVVRIIRAVARRAAAAAAKHSEQVEVSGVRLFHHSTILAQAKRMVRLVAWILIFAATFAWLDAVLTVFPQTRPWGEDLAGMFLDSLTGIGLGMLESLPGLFFIVVIAMIANIVLRAAGVMFDRVRADGLRLGPLDRDTARPLQLIFSMFVVVFSIAMAYPYIPGADSRALQGLSVLVGLMVSIGASGTVGHAVSGLILMFTRAFRVGDHVRIGDAEGTVMELGLFVTRLRSGMGDEIQLPNTLVLASASTNFSRAGPDSGFVLDVVVTIGYDAPWRLVCAMLIEAARRTPQVSADPAPRVMQASLDDFYVKYRLAAHSSATQPQVRAEARDRLLGNIQDVFNANGVQIMSPHYLGDPARAKVVPPDRWHVMPAAPES